MVNIFGLKVIFCIDFVDVKGLFKLVICDNDFVCVMELELLYGYEGEVFEGEYLVFIGKVVVCCEGIDVILVFFNKMMLLMMEVVEKFEVEGISVEVIDLCIICLLDYYMIIELVKKINCLVVIDEFWLFVGVFSEVVYEVQKYVFDYLDVLVICVNVVDVFLFYFVFFVEVYLLNVVKIIKVVKEVVYVG